MFSLKAYKDAGQDIKRVMETFEDAVEFATNPHTMKEPETGYIDTDYIDEQLETCKAILQSIARFNRTG